MNRRQHIKLMAATVGATLLTALTRVRAMGVSEEEGLTDFDTNPSAFSVTPALTWLRFGDVMPEGWLREQMRRDLSTGFAGHLNELCDEAAQDIFATGRNTIEHRHAMSGNVKIDWWDGETEGNWRTGYLMLAYLSGDETYRRRADEYVAHVLASQDPDGYLGVYSGTLKYQSPGELWTQACLLRGLLAYAELANRSDVLDSVTRAVDAIMQVFGPGGREFSFAETHDLMIVDVMERLEELTGDPKYSAWGLWMYESWSRNAPTKKKATDSDDDTTLPALLDPSHPFFGHGVHVMEHLRIPLWLSMTTTRKDIGTAAHLALEKAARYSQTGGSVVSMERIGNKTPDPLMTEYEYCTTKETLHTYLSAMQKMGSVSYADRVECVFLNDAQGSRMADGSAISYLSSDNRFRCDGRSSDGTGKEPRNKFSPTHRDVAVCCNPMSTQVAPLYVRGMWLRHPDGGLAAMLYGPSTLKTDVKGSKVIIRQETGFPMEQIIRIQISVTKPADFKLHLRNPGWSSHTQVRCPGARVERVGDFWQISKRWTTGDRVTMTFSSEIRQHKAANGETALSHGALIYALPLEAVRTPIKEYAVPGFEDTYFQMARPEDGNLAFDMSKGGNDFRLALVTADQMRPFDAPLMKLAGPMIEVGSGKVIQVELVPLGNAHILRRTTFPVIESGTAACGPI
jgi:DUF1680 family protein